MKKMRFVFPVLVAAAVCCLLVSCSKDYTGKEKTHPVFVKAGSAQNSGDYAGAAKLYEEFLLVAPKSAETHMRLAAIYGDNLDVPVKAIYHYERVLELRPDDTVNNDNIRSFISVLKKKLYEQLKTQYHDVEKDNAVKAELEKTRKLLDEYRTHSAKLRELVIAREKKWLAYKKSVERRLGKGVKAPAAKAAVNSVKKDPAAVKGKTVEKKDTVKAKTVEKNKGGKKIVSAAGILGRHTVKKGESLRSIARKYYGNAKYYKLIAEANKGKLPANLSVRVGQVLEIPRLPAKK